MRRRAIMSVLGATALIAASVVGASSASALAAGATAPATDFGSVTIYGTVERDVVVTASGDPVAFGDASRTFAHVGGAADATGDFSVVSNTCSGTITAETTCAVRVSFKPFAVGLRQATLSIATTSPPGSLTVALSGTGVPDATGTYYGLATPTRFLDTRLVGTKAPLAAGSTTSVQITNRSGIPASGVSAVVLNLTAVATASQGFFTVYPSDTARPTASTINFPIGWIGANMATVPLGADGKIKLYNSGGKAHAIVDVLGWYAKDDTVRAAKGMGAQFLSTDSGDPERVYDSRDDPANANLPFYNSDYIEFTETWGTAAEATAVKAVAMSITAVDATSSGVLTTWSGGAVPKPLASTVNYAKGTVAPNMAIVTEGHYNATNTGFRIQNAGGGSVHIVIDITGYYLADASSGMRFKPLVSGAPVRILDTHTNTGLSGPFGARQTRTAPATSVANPDSIYLVGNTTGDKPTAGTYLTVWSGKNPRPGTSNLNVNAGATRAVSTYAPLALNAVTGVLTYTLYNNAGSMRVIFDAVGTLDLYPDQSAPAVGPAAAQAANPRTADRTLGGRTIPGPGAFARGHEGTTARRG